MSEKGWEGFGTAIGSMVGERLASPLISTFAISWSLWNFKFFVILFSKNSVTATYALIQAECFPTPFMSFFNGLLAPLVLTMAYFYLLPVLSKIIFEEWSRTQKETKDIKQRWEDQQLLGSAEALQLRRKLRAAEVQIEDAEFEMRKLKADGRLNDQRLLEEQEAHRVALANHKAVSEDLSKTSALVDDLRNDASNLQIQLSAAASEKKALQNLLTKSQEELASQTSTAQLNPRIINLLKSLIGGQVVYDAHIKSLQATERLKLSTDREFLRKKGFTRATGTAGERDRVTPRGLAQLILQGKLDHEEFLLLSREIDEAKPG